MVPTTTRSGKVGPKHGAIPCGKGEDVGCSERLANSATCLFQIASSRMPRLMGRSGAFLTFQKYADHMYPGWKDKLGYTGGSTVQAATFDWKKKAAAAAFLGSVYALHPKTTSEYWSDVGYFSYGTAKI